MSTERSYSPSDLRRPASVDVDVVVGRRRPVDNPLIGSHEVGKPRRRGLSPHTNDQNWTYGMPSRRDSEGAAEVVLSWRGHSKSPPPRAAIKDFLRMNKRAAASGCVTSASVRDFRKNNELHAPQKVHVLRRSLPRTADPTLVYGHSTKAGISVGELITHKYETEWIEKQLQLEQKEAELRRRRCRKSERRQFIHPPPPPTTAPAERKADRQFMIAQYSNVRGRVEHSRTPQPRQPHAGDTTLPPVSQPRSRTPAPS